MAGEPYLKTGYDASGPAIAQFTGYNVESPSFGDYVAGRRKRFVDLEASDLPTKVGG